MKKIFSYSIPYPKFTREENKSCKLIDIQIHEIQDYFKNYRTEFNSDKALYFHLAKKYNVHYQTIHYWCKEEYRKVVLKNSIAKTLRKWKENKTEMLQKQREYKKDWAKRKKNEFKNYNKEVANFYNKNKRAFIKENKKEFIKFMKSNSKI